MSNLLNPLVKQLEKQQLSISDKEIKVMKELPMKKKPKTRRKKKDVDDDFEFLDSVIAVNKKENASNNELAE